MEGGWCARAAAAAAAAARVIPVADSQRWISLIFSPVMKNASSFSFGFTTVCVSLTAVLLQIRHYCISVRDKEAQTCVKSWKSPPD